MGIIKRDESYANETHLMFVKDKRHLISCWSGIPMRVVEGDYLRYKGPPDVGRLAYNQLLTSSSMTLNLYSSVGDFDILSTP